MTSLTEKINSDEKNKMTGASPTPPIQHAKKHLEQRKSGWPGRKSPLKWILLILVILLLGWAYLMNSFDNHYGPIEKAHQLYSEDGKLLPQNPENQLLFNQTLTKVQPWLIPLNNGAGAYYFAQARTVFMQGQNTLFELEQKPCATNQSEIRERAKEQLQKAQNFMQQGFLVVPKPPVLEWDVNALIATNLAIASDPSFASCTLASSS